MNALLIINPASGRNLIGDYVDDILSLLRKKGFQTEVCETRRKDDAKYFAKEKGESCDLIVCCGGDGTLSEVTNGVAELHRRPAIGYIPTGTTNAGYRQIRQQIFYLCRLHRTVRGKLLRHTAKPKKTAGSSGVRHHGHEGAVESAFLPRQSDG